MEEPDHWLKNGYPWEIVRPEHTQTVLFEGRMEADFYNDDKQFVESRTLERGDLLVLVSGGHGFRCTEDTVLLEIKQGPYIGPDEKERF